MFPNHKKCVLNFSCLQYVFNLKTFNLIILFLFTGLLLTRAQEQHRPKVALVLSGGGAKGLAHIPLLQTLDSLGIVPDMVIGNSMGSIVGGLYAMGYSGDSIAQIAHSADWDKLMGGTISMRNVGVEEKSEFNRYLVNFDRQNGKIKVNPYILNDHYLRVFLTDLTYPVRNITDFDELPIPFRAVATDIVNGKEVILDNGNLTQALRSSMSIPGVFYPVPYQNTLLVDGGVLNNFPVNIAKDMHADIIIGSDVGGGMEPRERLNDITTLLFQTGMLHSNLRNPENRAFCDILLDHVPNLTYSTGDFNHGDVIYEEGKIATFSKLDTLSALAKRLQPFHHETPHLPQMTDSVVLDTVIYRRISKANMSLVRARTDLVAHKKYAKRDIFDRFDRAMGTTLFSHITFDPYKEKKSGLIISGYERSKHIVKGALHYDSYNGVGIIMNLTGRNILGGASRSLISLDIAEEPRFRLQHQKNFGGDRNWWWRSEAYGHLTEESIFIDGQDVDDFHYRHFIFDNQFNRNLTPLRSYLGIGVKYQNDYLTPKVDPKIDDNTYSLEKSDSNTIELSVHYVYNSLNTPFYATYGSYFKGKLSRSLYSRANVVFYQSDRSDFKGETNLYNKLEMRFEKRLLLDDKVTAILGLSGGLLWQDMDEDNTISASDYGISAAYFLGGVQEQPSPRNYVMPGLKGGELIVNQFIKFNTGIQYRLFSKSYITPHLNLAMVGFDGADAFIRNIFSTKNNWDDRQETSMVVSSGITFSNNSLLGPMDIDISWINKVDKLRLFIGVGYRFNLSD
jgi:NTE family protein